MFSVETVVESPRKGFKKESHTTLCERQMECLKFNSQRSLWSFNDPDDDVEGMIIYSKEEKIKRATAFREDWESEEFV